MSFLHGRLEGSSAVLLGGKRPVVARRFCHLCERRRHCFLMYAPRTPKRLAVWLCARTCAIGPAGMLGWRMVMEEQT